MAKPDLWSCVKFKRLCRNLDLPRPHIVGLLETLWQAAYATASEYIGDSEDVECAAEWNGKKGVLTEALVESGFIDRIDDKYYVHDLSDHAPDYVKKRMARRIDKGLQPKTADNGGQRQTLAENVRDQNKNGALPTHPPTHPVHPPSTPSTPNQPTLPPPPSEGIEDESIQKNIPSHVRRMAQAQGLPPIPTALNVPKFVTSWGAWLRHMKQKGETMTHESTAALFVELEGWGPDVATDAINFSIRSSWRSIHRDTKGNDNGHKSRNELERDERKSHQYEEHLTL
jgi:hypothetical protein